MHHVCHCSLTVRRQRDGINSEHAADDDTLSLPYPEELDEHETQFLYQVTTV